MTSPSTSFISLYLHSEEQDLSVRILEEVRDVPQCMAPEMRPDENAGMVETRYWVLDKNGIALADEIHTQQNSEHQFRFVSSRCEVPHNHFLAGACRLMELTVIRPYSEIRICWQNLQSAMTRTTALGSIHDVPSLRCRSLHCPAGYRWSYSVGDVTDIRSVLNV